MRVLYVFEIEMVHQYFIGLEFSVSLIGICCRI